MKKYSPFFSIIIPTYNRPEQLDRCLSAITALDYPRNRFEVIVVDDGGSRTLEPVIDPFGKNIDITLLKEAHMGLSAARNAGALRGKGEILAFMDDDCMPSENWLTSLAVRFGQTPNLGVGGRTINALAENPFSTASQLLIDYLCHYYNKRPDRARFSSGSNLNFSTDAFHAVGGFNTRLSLGSGEDREICYRWILSGRPFVYAPEVVVYHYHFLTWRTFIRQHFNYGRGSLQFRREHARQTQDRISFEPLSFYRNLIFYPLIKKTKSANLSLFFLILLSQISAVAGVCFEWMGHRK